MIIMCLSFRRKTEWKQKESERINKKLELVRELENTVKYEGDGNTSYNLYTWNGLKILGKKNWRDWKSEKELRLSRL